MGRVFNVEDQFNTAAQEHEPPGSTSQYLGDVGLRGQADHDVQFLQFHINWVIVLDKEHFDLLLEDLRPEQKQFHVFTKTLRRSVTYE